MATAFEVSLVTVANWLRRHDFPGGKSGPWESEQIEPYIRAKGLGKFFSDRTRPAAGGLGLDSKTELECKKLLVDVRTKRHRLKKLRESVVDRKEILQAVSEMCLMFKTRSLELSGRIGALVPVEFRPAVEAEVDNEVRKWLKEMAAWRL